MSVATRRFVLAILLGGLIAGSLDIFAAALIYHAPPGKVLQSIASGLLGRAAFRGGAYTAWLGLILQWLMSLIIAAIYVAASRRLPVLVHRWPVWGFVYGLVVFAVMNYLVVPLSAARPGFSLPHFTPRLLVENLLAMIVFGEIIAAFARHYRIGAHANRTG